MEWLSCDKQRWHFSGSTHFLFFVGTESTDDAPLHAFSDATPALPPHPEVSVEIERVSRRRRFVLLSRGEHGAEESQ